MPALRLCRRLHLRDPQAVQVQSLQSPIQRHVSGTIFASRKLSIRDYLLAIAIFVNGAKGHSALQLSRDLDCQYKTAFVLAHKIREAMASEANGATVSGEVEIDGAYFGGHVQPAQITRSIAATVALQRIKLASAASLSSCASAAVRRCLSYSSPKMLARHDCAHRCARQHRLCRRSNPLGRATRAFSDEADQSL